MTEKPQRATVSFTQNEWEEFVDGGVGWRIVSDEMTDHTRWSIVHKIVIERLEDGTFWRGTYEEGATENQWHEWDERWGGSKATLKQVFQKPIVKIIYE